MLAYNGSVPSPTLQVEQGRDHRAHPERRRHRDDGALALSAAGAPIRRGFGTRPNSRSRSAAVTAARCSSPTPASTGITRTSGRSSLRRWASREPIVLEPTDAAYWPDVECRLTMTLDDLLVEGGHIVPFHRSGRPSRRWGRYGNELLIQGDSAFAGEATMGDADRLRRSGGRVVLRLPDASVAGSVPARCAQCGMKLVPANAVATPAQSEPTGHDHGDGLEWSI